ncbi:ATP:corrinoid adenosyltransferase [Rivularia sp. PCC 7116]|uniref:P-loop NTPase family protein n=1 Tax=Rivularia sp. PCC 7116 TaxID=373994 RepID=UPI00029EF227|nr:P-loop NTPase family protein [Rivularia sp. PCC 7116]AFY57695.1 ATP:corrinoid adenosyltransferase [Rivularia sp. PCC 7116]
MVAQLETSSVNSTVSLSHTLKGLVQVFTSSHRSFFTSVMAQALRIAGQGTPVLIVQFLKGGIRQGHKNPVVLGQNLDWIRCDLPRCIDTPQLDDAEAEALHLLWEHTQSVVNEGKYSLVVLDELSLAMNFGLIGETEVIEFLSERPQNVDIILTGAEMPQRILDLADEITEIRRPNRL